MTRQSRPLTMLRRSIQIATVAAALTLTNASLANAAAVAAPPADAQVAIDVNDLNGLNDVDVQSSISVNGVNVVGIQVPLPQPAGSL